jgi:hypothetical protein
MMKDKIEEEQQLLEKMATGKTNQDLCNGTQAK